MYSIMRGLIVAGTEAQESNCRHPLLDNQHLNCLGTRDGVHDGGQDVIGKAVTAAILTNPAMLVALGG